MKTLEYYMSLQYRLIAIPDIDEGGYAAYFPHLRGCMTCGETLAEVCLNALDAKREWLSAAIEDGNDIPEPSDSEVFAFDGEWKLEISGKKLEELARRAAHAGSGTAPQNALRM